MPGFDVYRGVTGEAIDIPAAGRAEADDARARLAALFDTHHPRLYALARRLLPTGDEARDLVQETFLRVARHLRSVPDGRPDEEAWLVRVMVNLCRDQWRRQASRKRWTADLRAEDDRGGRPSNQEDQLVAHDAIWHALRQLTPRRRAVLILCELDGCDIGEIATKLGVSRVTVRWHLSRGRRDLARIIEGKDEDRR